MQHLHPPCCAAPPPSSPPPSPPAPQGELEVTTLAGTGKGKAAAAADDVVERVPFLLLGLDLPAAPLFKDAMEKNIIPQVGVRRRGLGGP